MVRRILSLLIFQSTLPRRERRNRIWLTLENNYFNPRSREGSDYNSKQSLKGSNDFNPRSREGSDEYRPDVNETVNISIHAPAKGAT